MSDSIYDNELSFYVPQVSFEQIAIKNLVSNQQYQRNLSLGHVRKVAANFDLYQINPVKVSRRDGLNYVFNGQHTIETVALVSGSRDTPVWCMVYHDIDYEAEADIFANQAKYVKSLSPYEIFMANIEANNDKHLIIKGLVESYSLVVVDTKIQNGICAVAALEYIYDYYGYHVLERTLRLCVGAWEGDAASLNATMLKGVSRVAAVFGDELKDSLFVDKVGIHSPKDIHRTAQERRSGSIGYAEAVLLAYNYRMKNPLKMERLYTKQKANTVLKQLSISDGLCTVESDISHLE